MNKNCKCAKPQKPCKKPQKQCKKDCANPFRQLLLNYAYEDMECRAFPKTCSSWYKAYYGESCQKPVRYLMRHIR
ncbi:MAG: hypothetical protein IJR47_02025 [Clostridia bacterium]|nr:hypothetical protein [Clostridia bacterium]